MHFYLGLSYLRQIKASLIYSPFPISKPCFVKSKKILMFHKSEVGIWMANVWLIQIYIVMGSETSWSQWKNLQWSGWDRCRKTTCLRILAAEVIFTQIEIWIPDMFLSTWLTYCWISVLEELDSWLCSPVITRSEICLWSGSSVVKMDNNTVTPKNCFVFRPGSEFILPNL